MVAQRALGFVLDTEAGPRLGFVGAHWSGRLPLRWSFWVYFALPSVAFFVVVDGLTAWINLEGGALRAASVALLLAGPALCFIAIWGALGAWRAAGTFDRRGGAKPWTLAARGSTLLAALAIAYTVATTFGAGVATTLRLAQGQDPIGTARAQVAPDGRRVRLDGHLGMGEEALVARALARAPGAYLLELDLQGGRVHEARAVAATVKRLSLQTRVVGACDNACVLIFLAGRARQIMPGARLGLSRADDGTSNPLLRPIASAWQAAVYRHAGLPDTLGRKMLATPPSSLWHPETDELLLGAVVGVPDRPLDIDLPTRDGASPREYEEALSSNPAWRALEKRFAGTIAKASAQMHEARATGANDEAAQTAAQRAIEKLLPVLLHRAGPAWREQYVVLLADQLGAARATGPAACLGVLAGDTAARRALPAPLILRESSWLVDVATEAEDAPRRLNALEAEVLAHTLGGRAMPMLGAVRASTRADDCAKAIALIAEVLRLPAPERRLAVRVMFDPG